MLNIPIYRAKKIDSDEYVEGILRIYRFETHTNYYISRDSFSYSLAHWIDPSTLSIHLPDMLSSDSDRLLSNVEKDLRIFASLSEDGKGGDILDFNEIEWGGKFSPEVCILSNVIGDFKMCGSFEDIKEWRTIIGIQQ